MNKQSVKDFTKEQLLEACIKLQDQVSLSIKDQQTLIKTKGDLDSELAKFRIMNRFGHEILTIVSNKEFGEISLEYFIELFNQAKGLLLVLDKETNKLVVQNSFGFDNSNFENIALDADLRHLINPACSFLSEYPKLHDVLKDGFQEAYIAPFYFENEEPNGIILIGQDQTDAQFYNRLNKKEFAAFNSFIQIVSAFYSNLSYRKVLLNAKEELEEKVTLRTNELEKTNEQLQVQAIELKRSNEDLEKFASVVSHDLKSPMRNIVSFSQLLLSNKYSGDDSDSRKYLSYITKSVSHLNSIINALLEYSKVSSEAEQFVDVDLNELIKHLIQGMKHDIEINQVQIRCNTLPLVRGSKFQLERLLQNLIDNAIKFKSDKEPIINISSEKNEDGIVLMIKDNGIGINEKYQNKIFELFQRLHDRKSYEGTGLGLSICKKIVERHNGKIWFESKGEGTEFFILLPQ